MTQNDIIQFVCFETNMEINSFIPLMENYLKRSKQPHQMTVQEAQKGKIKYVSRHHALKSDFRFVFARSKNTEPLLNTNLRVIQAGGYFPVKKEHHPKSNSKLVTVLFFLNKEVNDISHLHTLENYSYLNVYEAYYENCLYPYILEFFTDENLTGDLIKELGEKVLYAHAGVYKECAMEMV
jgi:hypothetical protein